jgi:hypothetical protein
MQCMMYPVYFSFNKTSSVPLEVTSRTLCELSHKKQHPNCASGTQSHPRLLHCLVCMSIEGDLCPFFPLSVSCTQGSAKTCSSTCTLSPAGSLHSLRRDPFRDKIREVGRGLLLADTETGRYGRLYSRRLCARRGADALGRRSSDPFLNFQQLLRLLLFRAMRPKDIPVSVLC